MYHSRAGGCSAGDCATVCNGVAAYYVGTYGYEAFGGRDYWTAGDEDEGYYDDSEALAAASVRSGFPGAVDNGVGRTTDPVVRKFQEKDPEFPKYDGNPEHFLAWFVAVEERRIRSGGSGG